MSRWREFKHEEPEINRPLLCYAGGDRGFDKELDNKFNVLVYHISNLGHFFETQCGTSCFGSYIITHWVYLDELEINWVEPVTNRPKLGQEVLCKTRKGQEIVTMTWCEPNTFFEIAWYNPTSKHVHLNTCDIFYWASISNLSQLELTQ